MPRHRVEHQGVDAVFLVAQEGLGVAMLGCLHVVVQVAVAQVAKIDQAHAGDFAGQQRVGFFHESGDARHRNADVVLDVQALFGLRQRNAFADVPQALGLGQVFSDHGVGDAAALQRGFEQLLEQRAGVRFALVVRVFQQHAPGRFLEQRHAQLRVVLVHQAEGELAHHLKPRQARAQARVRQAQQVDGGLHAGHGGPGGQLGGGAGVQLQRGGGDDAQRAFAADVQVAQVVAGVVLAQAGQAAPDLALRGDHFQAQAQLARVAVAHHLRAARVGGQVAADGAAALGGQAQGEKVARRFGRALQVLQDAACFHGDGQVGRVHRAHLVHAPQAEQHLRASLIRHRSHGQPRVAALRHDGGAVRHAGAHHGGHLLGTRWAHHGERTPAGAAAPVVFVGAQVALGQNVRGAHRLLQGFDQGAGG